MNWTKEHLQEFISHARELNDLPNNNLMFLMAQLPMADSAAIWERLGLPAESPLFFEVVNKFLISTYSAALSRDVEEYENGNRKNSV